MKDLPVFTTERGAASLILREIPSRQTAYIRIQDSLEPEAFVKECADFCRACGAERIYATGHETLEAYPLHTAVLEMTGTAWVDRQQLARVFPVTDATAGRWREIYNQRMAEVDNAQTLEAGDERRIAESVGAYFIHDDGNLLGIGWLEDCKLLAVAAAKPGAGERVMHTLMSLVEGDEMTLEVASTNQRAIRLYEKLGFLKRREISRWYAIP
ncbi:MAG: GNAT family N-acetyltransferase [Candidatus Faecousia sp.]|nr:GNAT family N-acetyltransferase [Candidatus Faecousia sp.]